MTAGLVVGVLLSIGTLVEAARPVTTEDGTTPRTAVTSDAPGDSEPPSAAPAEANRTEPEVLARVNGQPVTRAEWLRLLTNPFERQTLEREIGADDPTSEDLGRLALRKLIQKRLFLQEASRRGLAATEAEVDETIAALRRRFGDLAGLGVWMRERGLDDQSLFDHTRDTILVTKVRGALAEGVSVTDRQVQDYYDAHRDELRSEQVWLQVIAVEEKETAEEIQAALGKGEDFGRLAQSRSIGMRAALGGDAGWVDSEGLWPPMRRAVDTLKPGEAIGPLQRGEEFLIVRLHERRPGPLKTLVQVRPDIERRLLPDRQREAVHLWLTEEEKRATIEILSPGGAGADSGTR